MRKLLLISFLVLFIDSIGQSPMRKLLLNRRSGGVDANAQQFIDSTGISGTDSSAIIDLVAMLKDSSLWNEMIAIYPFSGSTSATHSFNLKDPTQYKITWVGSGTHSASGYSPDGASYGNTNLNGSTVLTADDLHFSYYSTENNGAQTSIDIGSENGTATLTRLAIKYADNNTYVEAASGFSASGGNIVSNTSGFFVVSRESAAGFVLYQNATAILTRTQGATGIYNGNMYIGASNAAGTPSYGNRDVCTVTFGYDLSAAQVTTLNNIIEIFNDALSRGVQ